MVKRWVFKAIPPQQKIDDLSLQINVGQVLASILIQRGVDDFERAKSFFRPTLDQLHDPFLMKDMSIAVKRLCKAMDNQEKIMIYGDYDVDGTTSIAVFYGFLKKIYNNMEFYVPDRHAEGYGVSMKGMDYAIANNFKLIISLDCGIKDHKRISYAKQAGIDFIVCDHHNPDDVVSEAFAILNPKQKTCYYPYKELSGCGVGFKFLQAFCITKKIDFAELSPYTDLLAVSIASDIVPLTGENRVLAYFGLQQINANPRPGLRALIGIAAIKNELDISSVVFGIAPRINAAGRIDHASTAVELLLSEDQETAQKIVTSVNSSNTIRRDFDETITHEALLMIAENELLKSSKSTVLFKNDWNKGVIGIVASRCIEKFYRPTIILTESNNKATGSARSVNGFDVYEAISACSDLLDQFGGHMYAAGLTLPLENVSLFRAKFEKVVSERIKDEHLLPGIEIDQIVPLSTLNLKFYNIIKQMGPFGPQHLQPFFVSQNVQVHSVPNIFKNDHIKFFVKQDDSVPYEIIGFGMREACQNLKKGMTLDICYTLTENKYQEMTTLQLILKDIKNDC